MQGIVINRDRKAASSLTGDVSVSAEDFKHAVEHTFIHETIFNGVGPEFWKSNPQRLPCLYDHMPFEGQIFSIPVEYNYRLKRWTVCSIFCSPYCAKALMLKSKNFATKTYTLFSLMMKLVYGVIDDIPVASDLEVLLYGGVSIDKWRSLPKEHVKVALVVPEVIPFVMQNRNIVSHVLPTHRAYDKLIKWNTLGAESKNIPDQPDVKDSEVGCEEAEEVTDEDDEGDEEVVMA
jgi:uncharacterized protein YbaR (Trm112 family)